MSTIHTGNTTTTGFSVTSDVTGRLVIKTGGSGGTTALTVGEDQRVTFANQPVVPVPMFIAYYDSGGSIGSTAQTVVPINTEVFDSNNWFDTGTYRYTPKVAGYYQFNGTLQVTVPSPSFINGSFYKNGSSEASFYISRDASSNSQSGSGSKLIYLNGSTDYVELYGRGLGTSNGTWGVCWFEGFLVRAT